MLDNYPFWKVVYEEALRGSVKFMEYRIYCKPREDVGYVQVYETDSLPKAQLALNRLKEIYLPTIRNFLLLENEPIMFEVEDQMYELDMILPAQGCVVGKYIKGNVIYGEIQEEGYAKFDYVNSYIQFYYKGDAVVKGTQLYLNGELLCNFVELENICHAIDQDYNNLDYGADKLIAYIANQYPEAKTYTCRGYTNFNIRR